ncbi:MAG TPA: DUF4242 domain-containing protein [Chitinophagaceae bacterium]|nr:DUF4242 domain-containing protein [Chitinophagaceae bacterium]
MKRFVIERNLPGAENLSAQELQEISAKWCEASNILGKSDTWVQSYIGEDKIYCIHLAENADVVREHARIAKFPINIVSEIKTVIDPMTSNSLTIP